ncbi:PAS domain-containing protein [Polluticoccus soli]|uniref:PAS domain-containing protein n=1 Tax=Polluticoccus soli TaxID=3034150 RepID=UPI0023E14F4B|nr:PAS domain-containing protein [Flavipsychrobacter sp. JY13-12]
MQQVSDFFKKLLDSGDFIPRWQDGNWSDFHGWLHIVSDLLIWSAYFAIPFIIIRFITARKNAVAFNNLYVLFAAFILACGFIQLIDAVIFWNPIYRVSTLVKFMTAIISWVTVFALIKVLPKAFSLKTASELQAEIDLRIKAEKELEQKNKLLSEAEKIAKLGYGQWDIERDNVVLSDEGCSIYGVPKGSEFSFAAILETVHPEDRDKVKAIVGRIIANRHFEEFSYRIIVGDAIKYLRVNGEMRYNSNGDIVMLIGTMQDVTERHQSLSRIEQQNNVLLEIASIHSHNVRGPLATIMGLASMFNQNDVSDPDNVLIIEGIKVASENLDTIVTDIVHKSWNVELMRQQEKLASEIEAA